MQGVHHRAQGAAIHDARVPADELDFNFLTSLCGMHYPGPRRNWAWCSTCTACGTATASA
jgi:hypothetical protein